jgi:hypothetical protein
VRRDVSEVIVLRPESRDPGKRGVIELPPARQVEVFSETT